MLIIVGFSGLFSTILESLIASTTEDLQHTYVFTTISEEILPSSLKELVSGVLFFLIREKILSSPEWGIVMITAATQSTSIPESSSGYLQMKYSR